MTRKWNQIVRIRAKSCNGSSLPPLLRRGPIQLTEPIYTRAENYYFNLSCPKLKTINKRIFVFDYLDRHLMKGHSLKYAKFVAFDIQTNVIDTSPIDRK